VLSELQDIIERTASSIAEHPDITAVLPRWSRLFDVNVMVSTVFYFERQRGKYGT